MYCRSYWFVLSLLKFVVRMRIARCFKKVEVIFSLGNVSKGENEVDVL